MTDYIQVRAEKDEFLRQHAHSPLPHEIRHSFSGLDYFEPNSKLDLVLEVGPADGAELKVGTSDGQVRHYRRAGTVSFEVEEESVTLALLETPGQPGYFLPFRDSTSGKETYGAGRYLDLEGTDNGRVHIDFNLAYNPYCAYNSAYSCPLPPHENWLTVPIKAGEREFRPE